MSTAIQQAFSAVIAVLMAKFMLNDVPHAAGIARGENLSSIRVQRLTVDMVMEDLKRTRRMTNPEMQESLGILKDVMAHYYLEPCVVAWNDSNLIGILVYDTYKDVDAGIQTTHIVQLASFTLTPGVGKALVNEVISIGRKTGSNIISVGHGPGARGFYEKLGFTQNRYEPGIPQSMMYRLKG